MSFIYYLSALVACGIIASFLFCCKNKNIFGKFISNTQLVSLIYAALFAVRTLAGRGLIYDTVGLNVYSPFGALQINYVYISTLLLWFIPAVMLASCLFSFFDDKAPVVIPIVRFISPVVCILGIVAIEILGRALDGDMVNDFYYRHLVLAIELGVGLGLSLFQLVNLRTIKLRFGHYLKSLFCLIGMIIVSVPCWAPKTILGLNNISLVAEKLSNVHLACLGLAVIAVILCYLFFKGLSPEQRRMALIYLSLSALISFSYNYDFSTISNPSAWPLHLCALAMFIVPFSLIFKVKRVYYFAVYFCLFGAVLAMIMPNTNEANLLANETMQFWINHYSITIVPLLALALKIFPRPKFKDFLICLVAFVIYFVIALIANVWISNYYEGVDFFFINSDFLITKIGSWAKKLRETSVTFNIKELQFVIYPVYQGIYCVVYAMFAAAMWFVFEQFYDITDIYEILTERNRKIKADRLALEAHLAGKDMQGPMNPQNEGKLILRNFCKRYSSSDVYAVYNANLEIDGGQIFGFLGPNGAGKSSIIKTIVGIQTITSGEIEVSGYDVEKQSVGAKMQIGFVPDHYALYENLTGREYINYIADLYNVSKADRDERISEYIERFRLEAAIDNPIKTYSHGMKQKITIMSALVHNPKVWILDEPLTGLDPESIFQVKECMKEHAAKGNIVFFSSHIIDVVENICDRIAIIRKGQILCTKTIAEIKETGIPLENFYMNMIDGNTQSPVSVKEAESKAALVKETV